MTQYEKRGRSHPIRSSTGVLLVLQSPHACRHMTPRHRIQLQARACVASHSLTLFMHGPETGFTGPEGTTSTGLTVVL